MPTTMDLIYEVPLNVILWLIITAVTLLIFSLGHYYIEAHRRDGPLVAVINKFEREVLILKKENSILEDRLETVQQEDKELEKKLAQSMEVSAGLEERVIAVTRDKEEEALQLKDKHRQLVGLLEEVVKQLGSTDSNENIDSLFDVVDVRAQLRTAMTERDDFSEKYREVEGARKCLEGHIKKITQEVAELKTSFETAEKEKIEALTKLQVLSNYFKEKESQLQMELTVQKSILLKKQSDDHTIYEQMQSLREENEKYKLQNESIKKEIVEQESFFKIQIANVEQKSHENWIASRQVKRRLKETQQEAAQLRNRLTRTMQKYSANYSMEDSKETSESNGDPSSSPPSLMYPPTSSPPFMMYPILTPPCDFVPPPPFPLDFIPPHGGILFNLY